MSDEQNNQPNQMKSQVEIKLALTPETDQCVKANKHLRFLQEDHYVGNSKTTYENPIVFLSRKLERERDMYQRQADYLVERLGETQQRMFDAERICNKIYIARNISLSEKCVVSALAEIDKRYRTQNEGN